MKFRFFRSRALLGRLDTIGNPDRCMQLIMGVRNSYLYWLTITASKKVPRYGCSRGAGFYTAHCFVASPYFSQYKKFLILEIFLGQNKWVQLLSAQPVGPWQVTRKESRASEMNGRSTFGPVGMSPGWLARPIRSRLSDFEAS